MKRVLITIIGLIALTGCSTIGGFEQTSDPDIFKVTIRSNAFSNKTKITNEVFDEAREACNGGTFSLEGKPQSRVDRVPSYANGQTITTSVYVFIQMIRCDR